jgi:pimeloyl-ACP methyl ester carboxylesterase
MWPISTGLVGCFDRSVADRGSLQSIPEEDLTLMTKFVLVHGAFQGGWVYGRVARMLREAGHEVYTPTLIGLGERSHLADRAINLDTHVQDIVNVFKYEDITDAILCGHSYGGMVITGVANEIGERIRTLFSIDAYAPSYGQSLVAITGAEAGLAFLDQASRHGGVIPPIPAAIFNVNDADAAWVDAMSVPQPLATFVQGARRRGVARSGGDQPLLSFRRRERRWTGSSPLTRG